MKAWLTRYISSWWQPPAVTAGLLAAIYASFAVTYHSLFSIPDFLLFALAILFLCTVLSVILAIAYQFFIRAWKSGVVGLLLLVANLALSVPPLVFLVTYVTMLMPSEDGFGKNIKTPADMAYETPLDGKALMALRASDPEGRALMDAVSGANGSTGDPVVSIGLEVMDRFAGQNRERLLRHLASSAKWFVTRNGDQITAARRYAPNGGPWEKTLNSYYSNHQMEISTGTGIPNFDTPYFQFRISIDINQPESGGGWRSHDATEVMAGAGRIALTLTDSPNRGHESQLIVRSKGPAVRIYEDSNIRPRPVTTLALSQVESELHALSQSRLAKTRGFDPGLLPPGSIKKGASNLHLVDGMQGGIYKVFAYVNPGEAGHVYLKAFEATRNQRLSEHRIAQRSTEYTGWSDDPYTQFLYNTEITVYEGDWGVYYPARFELWFVPASGGPERKLFEKIFRIEGWMR